MNEVAVEELSASLEEAAKRREAEFQAVVKAGTNLPELLERLCPDGVEYRPLGELGIRHKGTSITAGRMKQISTDNGELTIYAGGKTQVLAALTSVPTNAIVETTAIVVKSRGIIDFVHAQPPFTHKSELWSYSLDWSLCNERFVYYYLLTQKAKLQKKAEATSVKMPQLSVGDTDKLLIPLPPVEVQEEIVRILDLMTELEAELEAELEKRRLQYAHYRDSFFDQGKNSSAPEFHLGEILSVVRGASPRPIQRFMADSSAGVPWIKIGDVPSNGKYIVSTSEFITQEGASKSRYIYPGDFVLSNSMSYGRPYISKITGCVHDGWLVLSDYEAHLDANYMYHLLRSYEVQKQFQMKASAGTVSNLNAELVRSVKIKVPPIAEQEKIASVLDQMDALVNDLTSGLPAELVARRKQYAYYRDRLLTFKEKTQM